MNRAYVTRTVAATLLLGILLCAVIFFSAGTTPENSVAQSLDFAIFCSDRLVVSDQQNGLSATYLKTGRTAWTALSDKAVDVGPVAADHSVGVVTDNFSTIYSFSKLGGKLLWHERNHSTVLTSDGRYFYVARPDEHGVSALDSSTGAVAWTLQIPTRGGAAFLRVDDGLLYSNTFVVDTRTRKLIYEWPQDLGVTAIAFPRPGETLVGDSGGNLILYDSAFTVRNRLNAGDGPIASLIANDDGILVSRYEHDYSTHRGEIEFLTWVGRQKWHIPLAHVVSLLPQPFAIVGKDALIVEPGKSSKEWRLKSRNLLTGKVNWESQDGDFFTGWPVICGATAFVRDGDRVVGFSVSSGVPYKRETTEPVSSRRER
jgi:hypothetical protein